MNKWNLYLFSENNVGQRKEFCRQRIPGSSWRRKETVNRHSLIRSGDGTRKTKQPSKIKSGAAKRKRSGTLASSDEHLNT